MIFAKCRYKMNKNLDISLCPFAIIFSYGFLDIKQCCQNILYLKYYTLLRQSLGIILYLYFISVKYFIMG